MNEFERAFKLMVEHDCYPDVWQGKAFVEGYEAEVVISSRPSKLDAVKHVILMAVEEKMS